MITTNSYQNYECAVREYLVKFNELTQPMREPAGNDVQDIFELPTRVLFRRAEKIAGISEDIFQLAQPYLRSSDPTVREGIRYHLIVQATAELLFAIELLQISEEQAGTLSTAAIKATQSAALREAVSAIEKSLSVPIHQGLPMDASYRATESATIGEATSGLIMAVEIAATSISHRVQMLGGDIAFDLISGTEWDEVIRSSTLSAKDLRKALASSCQGASGNMLLHVYARIMALAGQNISAEARLKILQWLERIKETGQVDLFNALISDFYNVEELVRSAGGIEHSAATIDSINRGTDLIKAFSDKFMVLADQMRKVEDAIRLGKQIEIQGFRLITAALQIGLLSALVYVGQDYIHKDLADVLSELKIEE